MEFKYPEAIVECDWLLNQLNNDNVRIYDCTTILHYTDDHPDNPMMLRVVMNFTKNHTFLVHRF